MSPPSNLTADSIRDAKVKVLKSLRRIDRSNVREKTVRGQYTTQVCQEKVPGYLEEEGANKSATPRRLWRSAWISTTGAGPVCRSTCVPGKRLPAKCSEVVVYFKNRN